MVHKLENNSENGNQFGDDSYHLLSLNQARKVLKIGYDTLRELILGGKIGTITIRNRQRIPMIQLKKFIDDNTIINKHIEETKARTHKEKVMQIVRRYKQ